MGGLLLTIAGAILGLAVFAMVACLTAEVLNSFRKKKTSTVVVADMKEILKEARKNPNAKKMTFEELNELEKQCKETPITFAEYDELNDEVIQVQGAKDAERKLKDYIDQHGILVISD